MKLKDDVEIACMTRGNLLGIVKCNDVFECYDVEMVITSLTDGKHMEGSKHYSGDAFDVRIWSVPENERHYLIEDLKDILGKDYDVVLEKDHIHIEYDPK